MTNISDENIRIAAYYIWEQAGCPQGEEKACWIKACEQLFAPKSACTKGACKGTKSAVKTTAKPVAAKPAAKVAAKPAAKSAAKPAVSAAPFYGVKKK